MKDPGLAVYKHRKSGNFSIEVWVDSPRVPGALTQWGELVQVPAELMQKEGLDVILHWLAGWRERILDETSTPPPESPAAYRKFARAHDSVSVYQLGGTLELSPSRHGRTGWIGCLEEDDVQLELPSSNQAFFEALMKAFSRCR
ncbi:MAG: hypothetical protein HYV63_12095 [Candidatus Schekmanbacteria bacterium]|nr:hypothetical protein [Candidatus Schekmanbacteria bacterium]